MRRRPILASLVLLSACNSPAAPRDAIAGAPAACDATTAPSATVGGVVLGRPFRVRDAALIAYDVPDCSGHIAALTLLLSDQDGLCERVQKNAIARGTGVLAINLDPGPDTDAHPGTYDINPDTEPTPQRGRAQAALTRYNGDCVPDDESATPALAGSAGSVVLSTLDANGHAIGSLEVTLGEQRDVLVGTFDVQRCNANLDNREGEPACVDGVR